MKKLDLIQGSEEWVYARAKYFCASDAAAMLGFDKKTMRNELLRLKSTGMEREFSQWVRDHLLNNGHEVEALARPIVESRLGESLDQIVAVSDDGRLLASFDGMTMMDDRTWENKAMNRELLAFITEHNDLPKTHWPQCEHQAIVSDGAPIYFTVSDGTENGTVGIWYSSKPERRAQILSGWAQFEEDLKNYRPAEVIPAAVTAPVHDLPVLFVQARGEVTKTNMPEFKVALSEYIAGINLKPETDQEFADSKALASKLRDGAKALKANKEAMLAQTASIGSVAAECDFYADQLNKTALVLEKAVEAEETNRKIRISQAAKDALVEHIATLNKRLGSRLMPDIPANFGEAMKNKRTLASLQNAVDTELSRAKMQASAIADRIDINQKAMNEDEAAFLFPDFSSVCSKANDDFAALLASRQASHQAAEAQRLEVEREKIRAEEQAKAQREANERAAAEQAERNRVAAEEIRKLDAERQQAQAKAVQEELARLAVVQATAEPALHDVNAAITREFQPAPVLSDKDVADANARKFVDSLPVEPAGQTMNLGQINAALGFTVTADFLAGIGILPARHEKNAKLYDAIKFPTICRLIQEHLTKVMQQSFGGKAA